MRLYIDDIRTPKGHFDHIERSSEGAIKFMKYFGCPEFVSFDFDLGGDDVALTVVKWMVEKDLDNPGWIPEGFAFGVHSANVCGSANIKGYLKCYLSTRNKKD